jgi:hypothetical protein
MIKIKTALYSLVAAVALSSAALTLAQSQQKPATKPAEAAKPAEAPKPAEAAKPAAQQQGAQRQAPQQRPAQLGVNPVAQAAANAGAIDCMGQINRVSNFLTANARSGAYLFLNPTEGAQRLTSASFEISGQNVLAYASASFSPGATGACQALYESVVYWDKPCAEVAKASFGTLRPAKAIMKDIEILADANTLRVFLMPAGKGCVSIKKDMIF